MGLFGLFNKEKKETLDQGLSKTKESVFSKLTRAVAGKSKVDEDTRRDLFNSVVRSIEEAYNSEITVLEAMKRNRNSMRMVGRKIYGKFIGTTLLTKGLEFDVVIVLDVNKFNDCKNLYVALSRCTTRLIVLGGSSKISF